MVTVDNCSYLPDWLSDDLATLATGGGLSKRELYSDAEECILKAQRPIVLNGIGQVIHRGDLLDRSVIPSCPVISEQTRRHEADFWTRFHAAHPRILGALLDAVVMALKNRAAVVVDRLPRMADFAIWNVAAEPAYPWPAGTFLTAYRYNRQHVVEAGLDGDPVVDVVRALSPWEGTASDLLGEMTRRVPDHITRRKDWFGKPRQVSDALRRLAPGLRRLGIDVTFLRAAHTGKRLIRLEAIGEPSSPSSPSSQSPEDRIVPGDDAGDQGLMASSDSSPDDLGKVGRCDAGDGGDAIPRSLSPHVGRSLEVPDADLL